MFFRLRRVFSTPAQPPAAGVFSFLDPGPLLDSELELVAPAPRWFDDLLYSVNHPLTRQDDPEQAPITREALEQFLKAAPGGHEAAGASSGRAPTYHLWMRLDPRSAPPLPMAGGLALRIGSGRDLDLYFGHIGYHVFAPARGHHYAERACRLVLPLARKHGVNPLWITTDPENAASRRTCERLGGVLVDTVDVPPDHILYARGEHRKCRFRFDL